MNNLKKMLAYMLTIALIMGTSSICASAMELTGNLDLSTNEITDKIQSIDNLKKQEKIIDVLDMEYVEFGLTDESISQEEGAIDELTYEKDENIINEIESLSNLSEKKLDNVVHQNIDDIVNKAKNNTNVSLLPSSYEILEKYGYSETVIDALKNKKNIVSGVGSPIISTKAVSHRGFEKTAVGYIKNKAGVRATYKMTIQWWRNTSNQIYYWDIYNKSTGSNAYRHIKHIHKYARTENSKKVLAINRISKFKKKIYVPALVPAYTNIRIWADCFRNGNIDSWYDFYASYD